MPRIRSLSWPLIPVLVLALAPVPADAQLCLNNSIYLDLSHEAASFPTCHDGVLTCQQPELQIVDVALDPPDCEESQRANNALGGPT